MKIRATLLAAFTLLGLACQQKQDPEQIAREYMEKNPEAVKQAYQRQQSPAAPASVQPAPVKGEPFAPGFPPIKEMLAGATKLGTGGAPAKGPENAPITIIEFSDFQCPYCAKGSKIIAGVMQEFPDKVRLVFRQFPLELHEHAKSAARASLAAREQGKFWEMHDALFAIQDNLSDEAIRGEAKKLGLNMPAFEKSWKSAQFDPAIDMDVNAATGLGVDGTPTFFVNGIMVNSVKDADFFRRLFTAILNQPPAPNS